MTKLALIPVLFIIACLFAGIYGAVHNQISYTVAPEYFTQFKFHQFHVGENVPQRFGAAIVGWNAAWWMGIVIGIVLIPVGLVIRGNANYFWGMFRVFGVVATTTLIVGLVALAIAFATVNADTVGEFTRYGNDIADDAAFARASTMHNFSYLGGLIGIATGAVTIYWQRQKQNVSASTPITNATEQSGERERD